MLNKKGQKIHGFMDMIDWNYELGHAPGGNRIYSSIKEIKKYESTHINTCGIVEVEVSFIRVVQEYAASAKLAEEITKKGKKK